MKLNRRKLSRENMARMEILRVMDHGSDAFSFLYNRKMLNLQHQHNNHTTTPHMIVDPTHWGPPSCEGLLYDCCDGVVYESNLYITWIIFLCNRPARWYPLIGYALVVQNISYASCSAVH
jgi:hypothetical protein